MASPSARKTTACCAASSPIWTACSGWGRRRGSEQGVQVLFCPDSSYTLHAYEGDSLDAIRPRETFWAEYLSAFGIANVYTSRRRFSGEVVAVAGQYFRNLQEEELRALFADNTVLLNGDAIDTLVDMGCGDLIGVDEVEWLGAQWRTTQL